MLRSVSAHIPWYAISNFGLGRSYKALRSYLVLPSATTLSNICRSGYALTMDAFRNHLPSRNEVCVALYAWTLTIKLAIMSVITYYMDQNWALREVQLTFDEVDCLLISGLETKFRMIGQGPTSWSKSSHVFERCA